MHQKDKEKKNKKKTFLAIFIFLIFIFSGLFVFLNKKEALLIVEKEPDVEFLRSDINTFTLFVSEDNYISLNDWVDDKEVEKVFGKPLDSNLQILGEGSDTFSGSFVKTFFYRDLFLVLFSPKDNGVTFWIQEISFSDPKYKTKEGVFVGATFEFLKEKYPNIEQVEDGRKDPLNSAYIISEENRHLIFEIENGVVVNMGMIFDLF